MLNNPIVIEVTRGEMVESRHRGAIAIVDTEGHVVASAGDHEQVIYARSAIKPLQALALVESGAADAFEVSPREIALACASHSGEAYHVEAVQAWLERIGCSAEDLECGAHWPYHQPSTIAMAGRGETPTTLHNNCSGKHSGFLTLARHLGVDPKGYIKFAHPVQQSILGIMEMMTGLDLRGAPRGIDGCGIPQIGIPLGNIALAMARMADPSDQPDRRQEASKRILEAMAAHPEMVAGSERHCTLVMKALKGKALIKTGAEGVCCGVIPDLGLGICLKIDDGAGRASEYLMTRALNHLKVIDEAAADELAEQITPILRNWAKTEVGGLQAAKDCPF